MESLELGTNMEYSSHKEFVSRHTIIEIISDSDSCGYSRIADRYTFFSK
jgi:hypothetical protein